MKIRFYVFLVLLAGCMSLNAMGPGPSDENHDRNGRCVKVPLDGGLLTVLGAAGIVYFIARKKNSK